MSYEVELKFRVPHIRQFEQELAALGAEPLGECRQADQYFRHPLRDFAVTDEAFRIRREGEHNWLTYKGPKLDSATKTRREIEIPFADSASAAKQLQEMLELLGFAPAAVVSKHRRRFQLQWRGHEVEVAIDTVDGLGTFAELEIVTEEEGLDRARDLVLSLAKQCRLQDPEHRSYLEMLIGMIR